MERLKFYCDQVTFEKFEHTMRPSFRFIDKDIEEEHLLIPLQTGMELWPALLIKKETKENEDS